MEKNEIEDEQKGKDNFFEFESLAAKKSLDSEGEFYLRIINDALKKEENKNIAFTGGYGAGKTTIIDAYFNEYKEDAKKMMKVSIATFQTEEGHGSNYNENILEQQILQQMLYQVNPNRIMNSRFIKISDISKWIMLSIMFLVIGSLSYIYWIIDTGYGWLQEHVAQINNLIGIIGSLFIITAHLVLFAFLLYVILMFFRKLGISKFGVANTNVEFNFQDGNTVFGHYLDEIIYLFKRSGHRFIVFEDLDRFNNLKIFERLRSLNTTLNNSAQLKQLDVKFIYALKDDIFTNEDDTALVFNRTKFFDFIIPTIKVMHSSNAESVLKDKLEDFLPSEENDGRENLITSKEQLLNNSFLEDIALFINDMRTLINICNEFEIYRLRLNNSSITYNHLFAFVVYKNIYPNDYSDLLMNKGLVYNVFNNKKEIINNLEDKVIELERMVIKNVGDVITTKDEVAYLFARKRKLSGRKIGRNYNDIILNIESDLTKAGKTVLTFLSSNDIEGKFGVFNGYTLEKSYSSLEEFITINSVNYMKLYEEYDKNWNEKKENVKREIILLKEKINNTYSKSISRLIKEDEIELNKGLLEKELLFFLIRNNWINESYEDYLTVFRVGTLSKLDNEFIRSVKLGSNKVLLEDELNNVDKVIQKIRVDDISSFAIINISFIRNLMLYSSVENEEKLEKILNILESNLDHHLDSYWRLLTGLGNLSRSFFIMLNKFGFDAWTMVLEKNPQHEYLEKYAVFILENCNSDLLLNIKSKNEFKDFVSSSINVQKLVDNDNMFGVLDELQIKFVSIENMSRPVVEKIVNKNNYQINIDNIRVIFSAQTVSIETIKSNEIVYNYCMNNLESFIESVLLRQKEYEEDESLFIEFIEESFKKLEEGQSLVDKMIKHYNKKIKVLEEVKSDVLIEMLYDQQLILPTWGNIEYCKKKLEENETNFNVDQILSTNDDWTSLINNSGEDTQEKFHEKEGYTLIVNEVLGKKEISEMINQFINLLEYPFTLDVGLIKDQEIKNRLISRDLIFWDGEIYKGIQSITFSAKYVIDNIEDAEEGSLKDLIKDNELKWSYKLIKVIVKREAIEGEYIDIYIRNSVESISINEFKDLIKERIVGYDQDLLQSLLELDYSALVIEYLLYLTAANSYNNEVMNIIDNNNIPWEINLFHELQRHDIDSAVNYLLHNREKRNEITFDQHLFERLIETSDYKEFNLSLIAELYKSLKITEEISTKVLLYLNQDTKYAIEFLNEELLLEIIKYYSTKDKSKALLSFFKTNSSDRENIFNIIKKLDSPFNEIKFNGRKVTIESTDGDTKSLLEFLKEKPNEVIYNFVKSEKGFIVSNKRK